MFKVDITSYPVTVIENGRPVEKPYDIRDACATILLNPQQKLNATGLLRANTVAQKILDNPVDFVLLEDAEYLMLRDAADKTVGFDRQDVELVNRIMYAKRVDVQAVEAPAKKEDNNDSA